MFSDFHNGQIALGESREQIRPSCNAQIRTADGNQRSVRRKNMHEQFRHQFAYKKKEDGYDAAEAEYHIEYVFQSMSVAFSPILGAKDGPGSCDGAKEHILNKLYLCCKGNGGHLILRNFSKHQGIACRYCCKHQALKCNRQGEPWQRLIEFLFMY